MPNQIIGHVGQCSGSRTVATRQSDSRLLCITATSAQYVDRYHTAFTIDHCLRHGGHFSIAYDVDFRRFCVARTTVYQGHAV